MDSIASVVPHAVSRLLRVGPMSQGKLDIAWRVAVGDALSRVSTARLHGDIVEVHPVDQRWQKELKRSAPVILSRLHALLGADAIARVVVK